MGLNEILLDGYKKSIYLSCNKNIDNHMINKLSIYIKNN